MNRRWFGVILALVPSLSLIMSIFVAPTAYATPNFYYRWVDVNTLVGTGGGADERFALNAGLSINGDRVFVIDPINTNTNCDNPTIKVTQAGASKGVLRWGVPSTEQGNNNCSYTEKEYPLQTAANATITLDWVDNATIQQIKENISGGGIGGTAKFVLDSTTPNQYWGNVNGDACLDYIEPGSDKKSATLHTRSTEGNGNCTDSTSSIQLGISNNASKPGTPTNGAPGTSAGSADGSGTATADVKCDVGSLSWLACPAIDFLGNGVKWAQEQIANQLAFSPLQDSGTLKAVWQSFRDLANVFFVVLFMLVIFGQAIGFDNYTIKKVLPRLVAAAVLIQFSWTIVGLAVDLSNVLGAGVASIVKLAPGVTTGADLPEQAVLTKLGEAITGIVAIGTTVALTATGMIIPLLLMLASALVSLIVAFITLQIRILIIDMLIVLAPIAILAWVLPNTDQWFKRWRKLLMGLLMMYPIVMLIFLAGALFSIVGANSGGSDFQKLLAALGPIISLFMVPVAFKAAENLLGKAGDLISRNSGARRATGGLSGMSKGYRSRFKEDQKDNAAARLRQYQEQGGPQGIFQRVGARNKMRQAGFGFTNLKGLNAPQAARLAGAIDKSDKSRQQAKLQQYSLSDTSAEDVLKELTSGRLDTPEEMAAITRLKDTSRFKELGDARETVMKNIAIRHGIDASTPDGLQEVERRYTDLLGNNFGDIKAKAAYAVNGEAGLERMTAAQLATQKPDTYARYADAIGNGNTKAQTRLETTLQQLQQNSNSRANWDASSGTALLKSLNDSGQTALAASYRQRFFENDGQLKAPAPGGGAPAVGNPGATPTVIIPGGQPNNVVTRQGGNFNGPAGGGAAPQQPSPAGGGAPQGGHTPIQVLVPGPAAPAQPPAGGAAPQTPTGGGTVITPQPRRSRPAGSGGGMFGGGAGGAGAPGAGGRFNTGRSPRISERLVDPRVEGDSEEPLR